MAIHVCKRRKSRWVKEISGSKDPNNRVLGPKYSNLSGIWALKPFLGVLGS